jgi:hypothetical protein
MEVGHEEEPTYEPFSFGEEEPFEFGEGEEEPFEFGEGEEEPEVEWELPPGPSDGRQRSFHCNIDPRTLSYEQLRYYRAMCKGGQSY